MARINSTLLFLLFGQLILHMVTGQTPTSTSGTVVPDPTAASPNIRTDVTDTVMALLNETGYSGSANDANVQEIVAMLMNGTVPTDADLIRLGFIPQSPPSQPTTPVPYTIPGGQPSVDTSVVFPTGNQVGPSTGIQPGGFPIGGFPSAGFPSGGFPLNPPTGAQGGSPTGSGGGSGNDPFGGALAPVGGAGGFPGFPSLLGTTPKPTLGDPFGLNSISGGPGGQLPGLGPTDPNALGPKPFPGMGPVGGLGTPGSTTDLLSSLGTLPGGLGSVPSTPQTGILDSAYNQQNRGGGNMMSNPMMMMMMMNPEIMDQMMSGENPMLTYMMMQQFMKRPQRPRPTLPTSPGMGGLGGLGGFPGGLGGAGSSGMPLPLPGTSAPLGGGTGGIMDLMGSLGSPGGASLGSPGLLPGGGTPMDLTALPGLGTAGGATTGAIGGNPMDLLQGGALPSPTGTAAGPADMSPFLNMINTVPAGTAPSTAPLTDPFAGTVG